MYIDELTAKHGEHFIFSRTGNGMRTACAEVDRLRKIIKQKDDALREASFLRFLCDEKGDTLVNNDKAIKDIHKKIEAASKLK
jgi:hypothetical protein